MLSFMLAEFISASAFLRYGCTPGANSNSFSTRLKAALNPQTPLEDFTRLVLDLGPPSGGYFPVQGSYRLGYGTVMEMTAVPSPVGEVAFRTGELININHAVAQVESPTSDLIYRGNASFLEWLSGSANAMVFRDAGKMRGPDIWEGGPNFVRGAVSINAAKFGNFCAGPYVPLFGEAQLLRLVPDGHPCATPEVSCYLNVGHDREKFAKLRFFP